MTVNVQHINGIRYGDFEIHGIKGYFPRQAITSTNLNHARFAGDPNFDFKTKFLEIIIKDTNQLLTNARYRQEKINDISQILVHNPDKLCLLVLNGAKSSLRA